MHIRGFTGKFPIIRPVISFHSRLHQSISARTHCIQNNLFLELVPVKPGRSQTQRIVRLGKVGSFVPIQSLLTIQGSRMRWGEREMQFAKTRTQPRPHRAFDGKTCKRQCFSSRPVLVPRKKRAKSLSRFWIYVKTRVFWKRVFGNVGKQQRFERVKMSQKWHT